MPSNTDRHPVTFSSGGDTCVGDLTRPAGEDKPPVVVMAHGFGAQRDFGLTPYVDRFVENGFAVYRFDYRGFGDSNGPHQLVDPREHRADWLAAIDAVRDRTDVDTERIALWGTSFSGGHVIEAAARRDVQAVVAQIPFVDGLATVRSLRRESGIGYVLRAGVHGVYDTLRGVVGADPHRIRIVAAPRDFALLNTPGAWAGYWEIVPEDTDWENACPARIGLQVLRYRPRRRANDVDCPVFLGIATEDRLCPPRATARLAAALEDATVVRIEAGHFDVYSGPAFERLVTEEVDFLRATLS